MAEETGQQAHQPPPPSGHRLLVVDDNQDAANSLAMLLRLQGHEVRVAYSGMAALEMTKTYTPDVVFLDIGMPGMDGYEVARRMRQQPGLGNRAGGADRLGPAGRPPPHGGSRVRPPSREAPGSGSPSEVTRRVNACDDDRNDVCLETRRRAEARNGPNPYRSRVAARFEPHNHLWNEMLGRM